MFVCLLFFFVFYIDFSVGWSAPEGAYCSPHAPSNLYHILQVIYIYVQIFFFFFFGGGGGLCAFLAIFVAFILITSLQEHGFGGKKLKLGHLQSE